MDFNYSVVIRTLGQGGAKYEALINSINRQTILPQEVVVVIPDGYSMLEIHAVNERVVYSEKGMVTQRIVGIEEARNEYLLVCDDDLEFECDFVERAARLFQCHRKIDAISPSNMSVPTPIWTKDQIIGIINGISYISFFSKYAHSIGLTGASGHNYRIYRSEKGVYPTQSANFQCFFIKRQAALDVKMDEELWLQKYGYAWPDDQIFFYKAFLKGIKTIYVPSLKYVHLDAGVGKVTSRNRNDYALRNYFIGCRNYTIFWYRFIYTQQKHVFSKVNSVIALSFKISSRTLFYTIAFAKNRNKEGLKSLFAGYKEAFSVVKELDKWN